MPNLSVNQSILGTKVITNKVSGDSLTLSATYASFAIVRVSSLTPSWPKAIRTNAFTYQKFFDQNPFGSVESSVTRQDGVVAGNPHCYKFGVELPAQSELTNLISESKQDFLTKLKAQKVNLSVAVGERKQTYKMITGLATSLSSTAPLVTQMASRNRKVSEGAARKFVRLVLGQSMSAASKKAANILLAYKYGLKPLLNDIQGLAEEVARIEMEKDSILTLRHKAKLSRPASKELPGRYLASQTGTTDVTCYARYKRGPLANASTLGLTNPASLAWELTTLSFVLDWAIGVGDFLNRIDATLGLTFIDGGVTIFEKYEMVTVSSTNESGYVVNARAVSKFIGCRRSVWNDFPSLALPSVKNPLKFGNAMSALALIRQRT